MAAERFAITAIVNAHIEHELWLFFLAKSSEIN